MSSCGVFNVPAATTTAPASTRWSAPSRSTYSTPSRLAVLDHDPLDARVRAQLEPARCASASSMYVFCVDLPAFVGQPCRHEPQPMQFASVYERTGSSGAPSARNAGLDRVHALAPVGPLAHAEPLLDAVVVRVEVGRAERAPDEPTIPLASCHFA